MRSAVSSTQLGVAVPLNPGVHKVVAAAPRHAQREFNVTLAEGAGAEVEVQPGPPLMATESSGAGEKSTGLGEKDAGPNEDAGPSALRLLTYGAFGLGGAGIVVGVATGIAAGSKHSALERECTGNDCPATAQSDLDGFHSLRTWSTIGYVVGGLGLAGGAALWLIAPSAHSSATGAGVWVGPTSAGVRGRF